MRSFAAQYIITNNGPLLKRAVVTVDDDGTVLAIEDTGGDLKERQSVEYHNGIIIPGFVNCHCHLELSHMRGYFSPGGGLAQFILQVRSARERDNETIIKSAATSDKDMFRNGIVLCADICNTTNTFGIKKESPISYINLPEVFGIDPEKAGRRMDEIEKIAATAAEMHLPFYIVPHSAYSMSLTLLRLLREKSRNNRVTSIHFMETSGEKEFLENHSGPLMSSYEKSGLLPSRLETAGTHADAVLNEITGSGNLILVHNTFADRDTIRMSKKRDNLFWCLCPNSNIYIEKQLPPLNLLLEEDCEIVIGTDSLASNKRLSILEELKTLQSGFPSVSLEELVRWATYNGAIALGEQERFGTIETGKKPGLLLLQNIDLLNMKLLPDSFVTRLV
jgi:cytosine/adenosine deaminase-related metal-dependent hydrolase